MNQILDLLFGVWRDSPLKKKQSRVLLKDILEIELAHLVIISKMRKENVSRKVLRVKT